jgi:hypothetical protein
MMKTNKLALVLTLTAGMFGSYAVAAPQTFTGRLTDNMCTKKHMMPGKSDAECVRECVKDGGHYVLVSGSKTLNLTGDQKRLNDLAGQNVKVTGELKGDTIAVSTISPAK